MPTIRSPHGCTFSPWTADKRCTVTVGQHQITVFHIHGIPPRMGQTWFRARLGDQLDPVPIKAKFTVMLRALEKKFG